MRNKNFTTGFHCVGITVFSIAMLVFNNAFAQKELYVSGFLTPIMDIKANKMKIPNTPDFYSHGYEHMPGDYYMRYRVDAMFTDKVEVAIQLRLKFHSGVSNLYVYTESNPYRGWIGSATATPDPDMRISATVTADVYFGEEYLGRQQWGFGSPIGNCVSGTYQYVSIKKDVIKKLNLPGTTAEEKEIELVKRIRFMNIQMSNYKQGLPSEFIAYAQKLYQDQQNAAKAEEHKKKQEADKLAAEKKAKDKEIAQQKEKDAKKQFEENNQTAQNKSADGDDFWNEGQENDKSGQNSGKIVQGTDGKYYRQTGNNNYQEVDYDSYMAEKHQQEMAKQKELEAQKLKENEKLVEETLQKLEKSNDDYWAGVEQRNKEAKEFSNKVGNLYSGMQQAKNAAADFDENSNLSGNYASIDDLMADFQRKMDNVNKLADEMKDIKQTNYNNYVDAIYGGSSSTDQALNQGYKLLGNAISQANAEKAKREARERLEKQKEAQIIKIQAERKRLLTEMRIELLDNFKNGKLPLSATKVESNIIYYFVYAVDSSTIGEENPAIYISNVFPVSRYEDGTWPLQAKINTEIGKLTVLKEVMPGYFTTQEKAEAKKKLLVDVFQKTGGKVHNISYKGKSSTASGGSSAGDFWETGSEQKTNTNTGNQKPAEQNSGADDFWNK